LIDFTGYTLKQHDKWWTYIGPPNMDVTEAYGLSLNRRPLQRDCFFNIGLWPHNTFYQFPFSELLGTFIILPAGPEQSILRFGYYSAHDDLPEVSKAAMRWMNEDLGPEDIELNKTVQKGLHSFGYDQGRYMIDEQRSNESEHLVHHFHTLVYQSLWDKTERTKPTGAS
jgi:choline monooxygenase